MKKERIMDKKWSISQSQWQLLLSQCGKELKYGIYFCKEKQEKRQVIENLYQMVHRGILLPNREKLVISSEYRRLLELCSKAKKGCFLENKEQIGNLFIYMGKECVLCEVSAVQKNCFIFSIKKREEILSYLFEIGFFPRYQIESIKEDDQQITYSILEKESWELLSNYKGQKIVTFLDLERKEKLARLFLSEEEGEEYLIWEEKNNKGRELLSEESLKKIWKELVENVVCGSKGTYI